MDGKITISASTLDEAITKALIELQTTSEHLQYEVVQKESAGLLGIFGKKPCIIRAHVMSEADEKELAEKKKLEEKKAAEAKKAEEAKKVEEARKAAESVKPAEAKRAEAPKASFQAEKASAQDRTSGRPVRKEAPEKRDVVKRVPPMQEEPAAEDAPKKVSKINEEAVKKAAKEFLEQVFGAMGMQVSIETVYNASDRELLVSMEGDDMGILIGKRGQTLDSLQYLVSLVVNKETEGYLRVKLDTENYRERRKETLETLAKNISYKVKRTKHPVSLEPMNPYERRIIHSALQNDKYVMTRSEGEDPFRHVVISLKKEAAGSNGKRERYGSRRDNRGRGRNAENTALKTEQAAEKKAAAPETEA